MSLVRVALPSTLRTLAGVEREVRVEVPDAPTIADLIGALERAHPALLGTIRDHDSGRRRAFMRYHACGLDLSHLSDSEPLPEAVVRGDEVFAIVGAISGGA